eukprot:CAMPEP_0205803460 /NCGR_PEP_ID=MMETSP0205-20121125/6117_1 /ASSEMBLY_ACC=CAM_ASM_000278 /TAXON_ID=36767 /ORGANISM="Euplotes focardii, Strain TN1" /LENGTH=227 /DNA_ID=CAMNT_0053071567 /DNA_START=18 /DNA_END=698 /DNA_ORIENTATION=+
MYTGFIFAQGIDALSGFVTLATIIVFLFNSYFIIRWTFLLLQSLEWKNIHYQRFLKMLALILRREYNQIDTQGTKSNNESPYKGEPKSIIKGKKNKKIRKKVKIKNQDFFQGNCKKGRKGKGKKGRKGKDKLSRFKADWGKFESSTKRLDKTTDKLMKSKGLGELLSSKENNEMFMISKIKDTDTDKIKKAKNTPNFDILGKYSQEEEKNSDHSNAVQEENLEKSTN